MLAWLTDKYNQIYNLVVTYYGYIIYLAGSAYAKIVTIAVNYYDRLRDLASSLYLRIVALANQYYERLVSLAWDLYARVRSLALDYYARLVSLAYDWYAPIQDLFNEWLPEIWQALNGGVSGPLVQLQNWIGQILSLARDWYGRLVGLARDWYGRILVFFQDELPYIWSTLAGGIAGPLVQLQNWIGQILSLARDWYAQLRTLALDWYARIRTLVLDWWNALSVMVNAFLSGTLGLPLEVLARILDFFQNWYARLLEILQDPGTFVFTVLERTFVPWFEYFLVWLLWDGGPDFPRRPDLKG